MGKKRPSTSGLCIEDDIQLSFQKVRQYPVMIAESIALLLYLLGVLVTLHFTMDTPLTLPVYLGAIFCAVLFVALYRFQKYRLSVLYGGLALTGVITFFLLDTVLKTSLYLWSALLNAIKSSFHIDLIVPYRTSSETSLVAILLLFCLLCSVILGYGIVTRRSYLLHAMVTIPFLWMAVNLWEETILSGALLLALSFLMVFAMRNSDLRTSAPPVNENFAQVVGGWYGRTPRVHIMDNPLRRQEVFLQSGLITLVCMLVTALVLGAAVPPESYTWNEVLAEFNRNPSRTTQKITERLTTAASFSSTPLSTAGIGSGDLKNAGSLQYRNQLHLQIRSMGLRKPMYLKGFVGSVYTGQEWKSLPDSVYEGNRGVFDALNVSQTTPMTMANRFNRAMLSGSILDVTPETLKQSYIEYRGDPWDAKTVFETQGMDSQIFNRWTDAYPLMSHPVLNRVKITNVNADSRYLYTPYFLSTDPYGDPAETVWKNVDYVYDAVLRDKTLLGMETYELRAYQYPERDTKAFLAEIFDADYERGSMPPLETAVYYRASEEKKGLLSAIDGYRDFVYENYLQIPEGGFERFKTEYYPGVEAYEGETKEGTIPGTEYPYIEKIVNDLNGRAYTLSPGSTPVDQDFVNYFLYENRQGYCMHFASAATLMFRAVGIPARYVEGYVVTAQDYISDTTANIYDRNAHAWTEIYMEPYGWLPVEVTPGFSGRHIGQWESPAESGEVSSVAEESVLSSEESVPDVVSSSSESMVSSEPPSISSMAGSSSDVGGADGASAEPLSPVLRRGVILGAVVLGGILLLLGLFWLRRKLALRRLERSLSQANRSQSAIAAYGYLLRLLRFAGFAEEGRTPAEFAETVEAGGGAVGEACVGHLGKAVEIVLEARFRAGEISAEQLKQLMDFLRLLERTIAEPLNPWEKLRYQYIAHLR